MISISTWLVGVSAAVLLCLFVTATHGRRPRVDASLFPGAYGALGDERLMYPVDMSDWPVRITPEHQLFLDDYLIAGRSNVTRQVHPPFKIPTHLLAIVGSSRKWYGNLESKAAAAMRGVYPNADPVIATEGLIVLRQDANVLFDLQNCRCEVDGKVLWNKGSITHETFCHRMKKGTYEIRLHRSDYGQPNCHFRIVDRATGQNILFHRGQKLTKELQRVVPVDGKDHRSVLLDPDATGKRAGALKPMSPTAPPGIRGRIDLLTLAQP